MTLKIKHPYESATYKGKTSCGNLYLTCIHKDGKLRQVEVSLAKEGTCSHTTTDSVTKLINAMIKAVRDNIVKDINGGVPTKAKPLGIDYVIKALEGQGCHKAICCFDTIATLLKDWKETHENIY